MKKKLLFTLSVFVPLLAQAESDSTDTLDPVVITATRSDVRESNLANTVTVITAAEIKARRINAVADILRVVPGLDVMSSGGQGSKPPYLREVLIPTKPWC